MNSLTVKQICLDVAKFLGRYRSYSASERALIQREAVNFVGDLPIGTTEHCHYRVEFLQPRPFQTQINNLMYTPAGMAWIEGHLDVRYSLREPALRDLVREPIPTDSIPFGVIIQAETPYTYGDWVSEHLTCLSRATPLPAPLLLPRSLSNRPYILRDLALLGTNFIRVEQPIYLQTALVLHKTRFSHYWTKAEALACKQALGVQLKSTRPGSIIYLSRANEVSAAQQRSYPSQLIAEILADLGAKIVYTRETCYEDYLAIANEAETVIADHGAAINNLLFWKTKNVIELYTNNWWTNCFLFLSHALGVQNHALVCVDNRDKAALREHLICHLKQFGVIN